MVRPIAAGVHDSACTAPDSSGSGTAAFGPALGRPLGYVEVFVVISTMFAAVALGQIVLFGGRYPRAASIWVGACFFPLQAIALCLWMLFETGYRSSQSPAQLFLLFGMLLLISIPIGAAFGYLSGGLVGGVFLILDSLAKRQRPPSDAIEPAEPQEPTNDIQG
jgi:hypothetical protein